MAKIAPTIALYFDIGSPFSYIAFHILQNSPVFSDCKITYVPVLARDLFQKCQNPPPVAVKNKFQWINKERLYWSHRFGVPMSTPIPEGFPASTGNLQAALASVAKNTPEHLVSIMTEIFACFWADGNTKIVGKESFQPIIQRLLTGNEVDQVLNCQSTEILDTNTEAAFKGGAFGLPWFECTNSKGDTAAFWGVDHLGRVADFLLLDMRLDAAFKVLL